MSSKRRVAWVTELPSKQESKKDRDTWFWRRDTMRIIDSPYALEDMGEQVPVVIRLRRAAWLEERITLRSWENKGRCKKLVTRKKKEKTGRERPYQPRGGAQSLQRWPSLHSHPTTAIQDRS